MIGQARKARGGGERERQGLILHDRHRSVGVMLSPRRSCLTAGGDWFSRGSSQKLLGAETEKQH